MKKKILVVEDDKGTYDELKNYLECNDFKVDVFTPSFEDGIARIEEGEPDIVLLDIELQGSKTGIDLGRELNNHYKIPHIYITQYNKEQLMYEAAATFHVHFSLKSKLLLETPELINAINTGIFQHSLKKETFLSKDLRVGVQALNGKERKTDELERTFVYYEDVAFFTKDKLLPDSLKHIHTMEGYCWLRTASNKEFLYKVKNIDELLQILPDSFIKISRSTVVNINPDYIQKRINGNRIEIQGQTLLIDKPYAAALDEKISQFFI